MSANLDNNIVNKMHDPRKNQGIDREDDTLVMLSILKHQFLFLFDIPTYLLPDPILEANHS